jgi:hypothetical protein
MEIHNRATFSPLFDLIELLVNFVFSRKDTFALLNKQQHARQQSMEHRIICQ